LSAQVISTGYVPRPIQADLHRKLKRFNVLVCHRRFGKTVFSINHMIDRALRCQQKNPQYAYLAPTFGQAKRVVWDYLKQYAGAIPGAEPNEADLRIDIPIRNGERLRFMLLGAENPMALKGIYLDGTILDEYAEMNPAAWREVIRPTLSDRQGWGIFIGTPKGQNSFYDLYERARKGDDPEWFSALYKASETGIIPQAELDSARREMTESEYDQEFECSFQAGLVGAYWGKQMEKAQLEGRICSVPYEPTVPVETFWDLGVNDTTAIWFLQRVGREIRAIDYVEESSQGLDYYAKILQKKDYLYSKHFLPHDAAARELSTGKSRQETFKKLGIKPTKILPRLDKQDQISAAGLLIPKVWFDQQKCERGIKCLQQYQRKWDAKQNVFSNSPLHNFASNGADAFQQAAIGLREEVEVSSYTTYELTADTEYDPYTHARS
jgi:phage terminase large subunit